MAKKYYLGKEDIYKAEHASLVEALCSTAEEDYTIEFVNMVRGIIQFSDKLLCEFDKEEE